MLNVALFKQAWIYGLDQVYTEGTQFASCEGIQFFGSRATESSQDGGGDIWLILGGPSEVRT